MKRHATPRGFTLAELLVGLVVTSIVLAAVAAVVIGVQNSYQAETEVKVVAESGRTAMNYIERVVPMAGYGVDPRIAIDVSTFGVGTTDNVGVAVDGGAVTDELRFRYRDPTFVSRGRLTSPTNLVFDLPLPAPLSKGALIQLTCRGAATTSSVRLNNDVAIGATSAAVTVAGDPFNRALATFSYANSTDNCLTQTGTGAPWVYLVHEQRLRVVNVGGRPWLVSYRNFTDDLTDPAFTIDGGAFDPIAPDVENFQVAFGMNQPTTGTITPPDGSGGNWIIGDAAGETSFSATPLQAPQYDTSYADTSRFTPANPANIRSILIGFTVRTSRKEPTRRAAYRQENLFNFDAGTPTGVPDGFMRSVFRTVIYTPNLASRSFFNPTLRTAGDTRDFNTWGG